MEENKQHLELQKRVEEMELFVRRNMTGDALSRFGIVKSAHPEFALQAIVTLNQLIHSNQVNLPVDERTLKYLLGELQKQKQEFNIIRK